MKKKSLIRVKIYGSLLAVYLVAFSIAFLSLSGTAREILVAVSVVLVWVVFFVSCENCGNSLIKNIKKNGFDKEKKFLILSFPKKCPQCGIERY